MMYIVKRSQEILRYRCIVSYEWGFLENQIVNKNKSLYNVNVMKAIIIFPHLVIHPVYAGGISCIIVVTSFRLCHKTDSHKQ